jgi:hypothetical protein
MAAALTVLVPRQTDQTVGRGDLLDETLGRHVGEVLAERIAWPVAIAEEVTDREVARVGEEVAKRRRPVGEVQDAGRVAFPGIG